MSNNCWAIIPARGGSKGVKGKNIKMLDGKPLLGCTINALKGANIFDRIVVTSDSFALSHLHAAIYSKPCLDAHLIIDERTNFF